MKDEYWTWVDEGLVGARGPVDYRLKDEGGDGLEVTRLAMAFGLVGYGEVHLTG